jgi:3-hydroxyisobutyrate dehydrogenase-like beta-hydroxyacid dehydrogenase
MRARTLNNTAKSCSPYPIARAAVNISLAGATLNSVIASPSLAYRTPFITKMPDEVWFSVNMMQKDMLLALDMGRELDVPLPTVALTNEFLTAARTMGLEKYDFAVVYRVIARLAGIDVGEM